MVELRRNEITLRFGSTIWTMTLELARLCGWEPLGTCRTQSDSQPDGVSDGRDFLPWFADYISNDGQTVTAQDAMLLSNALAWAADNCARFIADLQAGRLTPPVPLRTPSSGFRWFETPAGKKNLLDLAEFCRSGEFKIC